MDLGKIFRIKQLWVKGKWVRFWTPVARERAP